MDKHRSLIIPGAVLVAALCTTGVQAEVYAKIDSEGNYLQTVVTSQGSAKKPRLWTVQRERTNRVPLNPKGDLNGDLWPAIVEDSLNGNYPWVVWSRFNGTDYDLAWSRWQGNAWREIDWVEEAPGVLGDDLDVSLTLDSEGRPYVAWWRDESGVGRVYLSIFLVTRWMISYPVSDAVGDGRYPSIHIDENGRIVVDYATPQGQETRVIVFNRPDTITDDLNPFDNNTLSDAPEESDEFGK